uniref:VPS9 domain containing 1 n=1 Tax=Sinocyclocheilus grahami TaxID=75366 RepID=A0A672KMH5_SINGR
FTLSLQRQMMENLIIAKARQDALQRKMEERRLRLQEEANRRFVTCGTMTAEEQEQRVLYASVLEYEQDHVTNLKKNPNDPTLVSGLISCLLSYPDHPVMKLLKRLQYRVYNRLYPIVSQCVPLSTAPGHSLVPLKPSRSAQSLLLSDSPISPQQQQSPLKSAMTHSLSDASISFSPSQDLNANNTKSETDSDEFSTLVSTDRENSFEDLEKFLTQLDWVPSHSGDDTDSDVTFETTHIDLESHVHHLEDRALKEHLKAIIKDIHISIASGICMVVSCLYCVRLFFIAVRTLRIICGCAEEYRLLQENDPPPKSAAIVCSTLLENILNFLLSRLTLKVRAHASILKREKLCWEIMWAVIVSVNFWSCHTH